MLRYRNHKGAHVQSSCEESFAPKILPLSNCFHNGMGISHYGTGIISVLLERVLATTIQLSSSIVQTTLFFVSHDTGYDIIGAYSSG